MTEKEKTIELSTEPTEKKKPHRRRAVVITVVALALLAAGGIAWKTHTDRLMAEARADCAAASERLRIVTNDYNTLLDDQAASMAKPDRKSVKDAKTLDVLSKAMKASTPKTVSCKADSRPGVQDAAKAITANAAWYKAHTKSLNRLVKAVETSKLDKTVDDADALYKETDGKETDGKVADGKTRASLLDAIKKRDADAIAKAVKEVSESKAAKEQADAEAKARAEQEAAAAAAATQQAQASQSQTYSGGGSYSNRGYSHSGASSSGSGGSASSPSQSNGGGSSAGSGSDLHIVIGGSGTPAQNGPSHGEPNF